MESNSPRHLKLGDQLQGVVVKALGGKRFLAKSRAAPDGWMVELHTRTPEDIELGANHWFWVARITPVKRAILVHDGDFGRLPISAAMGSRYLASLQSLFGLQPLTGDTLADARSMVVRIEQKNQADWLSVWKLLSEPATRDVKELLQEIDEMRTARKEAPDKMEELQLAFLQKWGQILEIGIKRLQK